MKARELIAILDRREMGRFFRDMKGRVSFAKNCRTSVEMIGKYFAAHIKTNLDAAAINIMRPRPKKTQKPANRSSSTGTPDPGN
jgi:hypothetical protein